ncbi:MAG: hypothetical protein V4723_19965 [Pseudomonadota bacterium]
MSVLYIVGGVVSDFSLLPMSIQQSSPKSISGFHQMPEKHGFDASRNRAPPAMPGS